MRRAIAGSALVVLVLLAAWCALPATAIAGAKQPKLNAEGIERFSQNPSEEHPYFACPPPTETRMSCQAIVVPPKAKPAIRKQRRELGLVGKGVAPALEGGGIEGGFSPTDLRSAYNLPEAGGKGATIAIVDAFGYPNAESDLNTYRAQYGLPACTTANGCFHKVNQKGEEANYPPLETFSSWDLESALDLDMASAMCPECKLTLVEADDSFTVNLGAAVNKAAELGATVISNSWGQGERATETEDDSLYYNHPGIPILFSSGDSGYGAGYPTSSPKVVSVGGTSLNKDKGKRGWHESAWAAAGSGCSAYEKKPEWQTDSGCSNRTATDVSAVADPKTPVSVYAKEWSGGGSKTPGWVLVGGTSASAPILAGIEARASEAERAKGPKLFWEQGSEGKLFDVAEGYNGTCGLSVYLCSGRGGYDGPTGWGTPGAVRPGPPVAGTYEASNTGPAKATLNGVVNPNGASTTYYFEWGTTTAYGMGEAGGTLSAGTSPVEVSMAITKLTWNTTYHYRIRAFNALGNSYGADHTFVASGWSVQEGPLEKTFDRFDDYGFSKGDVSCSSASNCIAVGAHLVRYEKDQFQTEQVGEQYDYGTSPMAERWNGSNWVKLSPIVPHEIDDFINSSFYKASCTSSTFCMLLGENFAMEKEGEDGNLPLLERWNGSELTLAPGAIPSDAWVDAKGFRHISLGMLSCVSSTYCLATGSYAAKAAEGGSVGKLMTQVWNGAKWEIVATQAEEGAFVGARDLSCVSPTWCMATGEEFKSGKTTTYFSVWNGSKWSTQSSSFTSVLRALSCTSATSCMAVGALPKTAQEEFSGVGLVWDGSQWKSASPGTGLFEDVSCLAANWCLAVGFKGGHQAPNEGVQLPSTEVASRWNGSAWSAEQPPVPPQAELSDETGLSNSELTAVSCKASGCTTVGSFQEAPGFFAPQVARLDLTPQNLTVPVVSPSSTVYQGLQESTTDGTWTGETGSFSYQWQRCNAEGKECASISGAVGFTYTPVAADVGKTLVAKVTAGGPAGSAPVEAVSKATAKVVALGQVSAYTVPQGSHPEAIAAGPDGNLWFTMYSTNKIGRITTSGTITEYALPAGSHPSSITASGDGGLWFANRGTNKIGRITTSGTITEYALPAGSEPYGVAAIGAGWIWFTNWGTGKVGKISTCCTHTVTEYSLPSGGGPTRITTGPDGNLWFIDAGNEKIGKITTSGTITEYPVPTSSNPTAITAGPDGNLWFTLLNKNKIGKITTSGTITEYALSTGSSPEGIAAGPDGNLWVTEWGENHKIARVTTSGTVTEFPVPAGMSHMRGIVTGSDNRLWFTAESGYKPEEGGTDEIGAIVP